MYNLIIKINDISKFKEIQSVLFIMGNIWLSDKDSKKQDFKDFLLYDCEYIRIKNNVISIINSNYEEIKENDILYDDISFLRTYKINKIYG